jgi:hypothetical protein
MPRSVDRAVADEFLQAPPADRMRIAFTALLERLGERCPCASAESHSKWPASIRSITTLAPSAPPEPAFVPAGCEEVRSGREIHPQIAVVAGLVHLPYPQQRKRGSDEPARRFEARCSSAMRPRPRATARARTASGATLNPRAIGLVDRPFKARHVGKIGELGGLGSREESRRSIAVFVEIADRDGCASTYASTAA